MRDPWRVPSTSIKRVTFPEAPELRVVFRDSSYRLDCLLDCIRGESFGSGSSRVPSTGAFYSIGLSLLDDPHLKYYKDTFIESINCSFVTKRSFTDGCLSYLYEV
eukprot:Awhi_evm1s6822